jgi:phosphate-selective porin OprO/OprP
MHSLVDRSVGTNLSFDGVYVFASWFLTGENRQYNRPMATFDRIKVNRDFFRVRDCDGCVHTGPGAWELAYRFSYLDLDDADITGGNVTDHTIGLNWYLNPYTRLMFNYVNSDTRRNGIDGNISIFEMRAQIDF